MVLLKDAGIFCFPTRKPGSPVTGGEDKPPKQQFFFGETL